MSKLVVLRLPGHQVLCKEFKTAGQCCEYIKGILDDPEQLANFHPFGEEGDEVWVYGEALRQAQVLNVTLQSPGQQILPAGFMPPGMGDGRKLS